MTPRNRAAAVDEAIADDDRGDTVPRRFADRRIDGDAGAFLWLRREGGILVEDAIT